MYLFNQEVRIFHFIHDHTHSIYMKLLAMTLMISGIVIHVVCACMCVCVCVCVLCGVCVCVCACVFVYMIMCECL